MFDECFNCGVSGERVRLFDAISGKGIVKICKECVSKENIPIIKKASEIFTSPVLYSDLKERGKTVYERLSRMSGIKTEERRNFKSSELKQRETILRDVVNRNFDKKVSNEAELRQDLIDNFHWVIMRARRSKHITQEQLAETIAEPEAAIKMAERGVLPEDGYKLVNKLENYLGIKLVKKEFAEKIEERPKEISFDPIITKSLTISDLQEMKKRKEARILGESSGVSEDVEEMEDKTEKEDLSQDENDLIFGKDNHNL